MGFIKIEIFRVIHVFDDMYIKYKFVLSLGDGHRSSSL